VHKHGTSSNVIASKLLAAVAIGLALQQRSKVTEVLTYWRVFYVYFCSCWEARRGRRSWSNRLLLPPAALAALLFTISRIRPALFYRFSASLSCSSLCLSPPNDLSDINWSEIYWIKMRAASGRDRTATGRPAVDATWSPPTASPNCHAGPDAKPTLSCTSGSTDRPRAATGRSYKPAFTANRSDPADGLLSVCAYEQHYQRQRQQQSATNDVEDKLTTWHAPRVRASQQNRRN